MKTCSGLGTRWDASCHILYLELFGVLPLMNVRSGLHLTWERSQVLYIAAFVKLSVIKTWSGLWPLHRSFSSAVHWKMSRFFLRFSLLKASSGFLCSLGVGHWLLQVSFILFPVHRRFCRFLHDEWMLRRFALVWMLRLYYGTWCDMGFYSWWRYVWAFSPHWTSAIAFEPHLHCCTWQHVCSRP